jgi:hypothetical protein
MYRPGNKLDSNEVPPRACGEYVTGFAAKCITVVGVEEKLARFGV